MLKQIIFLLIILGVSFNGIAQKDQRYSVDKKMAEHKFLKLNIKHFLKKKSKQRKADDKKEKDRLKYQKKYDKEVIKRQKKLNNGKLISTRKSGYKSMKRTKKESKRINKNKPKQNWFQRKFNKN